MQNRRILSWLFWVATIAFLFGIGAATCHAQFGSFYRDLPYLANDSITTNDIGNGAFEYWNMDTGTIGAGSYSRLNLSSGNPPTGTTLSVVGNAGYYNGGSDRALGDNSSTNFSFSGGTNSWSMSLWANVTNETVGTSFGGPTLASLWNAQAATSEAPNRYWKLGYETNGLYFRARIGGVPNGEYWALFKIWSTNSAMTNRYVHFAFGYDASATNFWYQTNAGPRQTYIATNSVMPYFTGVSSFVGLSIGNWIDGGEGVIGNIDEVCYWNRALSTAEVTSLYGGGTSPLVWSSAWRNNYYYPTNHNNLFDPSSVGSNTLAVALDVLRPETFMGPGGVVAPPNNTQVTNWFCGFTTNMLKKTVAVGIATGPTYFTSGAGTNLDKPRLLFNTDSHLQARTGGDGRGRWTNFTLIVVKDLTSSNPLSGGTTFTAEHYGSGQQSWQHGEYINTSATARGGLNINTGDNFAHGTPETLFTNIQVYTYVQSNNTNLLVRTNGVDWFTKNTNPSLPFIIGELNGIVDTDAGQLNGAVKFNLCRFWLWGTNMSTAHIQAAENACRLELGVY